MSPSFVPSRTRIFSPALMFGCAVFLGGWLLFQALPMIARTALPHFGSAPAVWGLCLVAFQATLLVGFLYARLVAAHFALKWQVAAHIGLLAVAFVVLPAAAGTAWEIGFGESSTLSLLGMLALRAGLPLFALSATPPLLQRWLGDAGHEASGGAWFLYGLGGAGALFAVLAYPLVIEPGATLAEQGRFWTFACVVLAIATGVAGCFALYRQQVRGGDARRGERPTHTVLGAPDWRSRLRWALFASVPAGMLVAVTTSITSGLAAASAFLMVPLALYLASFLVAYLGNPGAIERWLLIAQAPLLIVAALASPFGPTPYHYSATVLLLAMLTVTAIVCHGRLAQHRPATRYIPEYFVWISVGALLGSAFAALFAPLVFDSALEFSILCAAAAFVRPRTDFTEEKRKTKEDFPIAASAILREISFPVAGMALVLMLAPRLGSKSSATALLLLGLVIVFAAVYAMLSSGRPIRFGLCIATLAIFSMHFAGSSSARIVDLDRSFFGTHAVRHAAESGYLLLVHGMTMRGAQHTSVSRRSERQTYYHAGSGLGRAFAALGARGTPPRRVGVVGIGAGEIACYRHHGQDWTFFEIDPAILRVTAGGQWFAFLPECAPKASIVQGEPRRALARDAAARFDLLVIDAAAFESLPLHLLTREAFRLYMDRLAPGGLLLVHVSHRFIDLEPVTAAIAADAKLSARLFDASTAKREPGYPFRFASTWIALARNDAVIKPLTEGYDAARPSAWGRWRNLKAREGQRLWTDDYADVLSALK